jgi:hypothetical protein
MRLGTSRTQLDSFDDVIRQLGISGQWSVGLNTIPTAAIIGSVDRPDDFDDRFRPRKRTSRARLRNLQRAFPDGSFPPISVYQIGNAYFVSDGHHRVALASMLGICYVDAEIIRFRTAQPPPPEPEPRKTRGCSDRVRLRDRIKALADTLAGPYEIESWA